MSCDIDFMKTTRIYHAIQLFLSDILSSIYVPEVIKYFTCVIMIMLDNIENKLLDMREYIFKAMLSL